MTRRFFVVCIALGACVEPTAALAVERPSRAVELPPANTLLRAPPPLNPSRRAPTQPVLPRGGARVLTRQTVTVSATPSGALQSVGVAHRLDVRGTGDYTFAVPAPVRDVVPARGSESVPGPPAERDRLEGFRARSQSARGDRLAARCGRGAGIPPHRRTRRADTARPVQPRGRDRRRHAHAASTYSADAVVADVATALDALARAAARDAPDPASTIRIRGAQSPSTEEITAAFALVGTVRFPPGSVRGLTATGGGATVDRGSVRFSSLIGGISPSVVRIRVKGVALRPATPSVRVVATPAPAAALPRPPASSWADAVRQGGVQASGRTLLARAFRAKLAYERTRQYYSFLGSPAGTNLLRGPLGPSRTTYVFRTVPARLSAPTSRADRADADSSTVPLAVVVAGALLAGAGLSCSGPTHNKERGRRLPAPLASSCGEDSGYGPKKLITLVVEVVLLGRRAVASNGKARKTTLYVLRRTARSATGVVGEAACAGAFGVIWSSKRSEHASCRAVLRPPGGDRSGHRVDLVVLVVLALGAVPVMCR